MLPLPAPYPDELVYSVLARFADRTKIATSVLLKEVFGFRISLSADLQAGVSTLAESLHPTRIVSGEEVQRTYTTFNYYAYVWQSRVASKYATAICSPRGLRNIRGARGRSLFRIPTQLRACERCMAKNVSEFGEAYWHRKHQLPGVNRCNEHGSMLMESDVPLDAKIVLRTLESAKFVTPPKLKFSADDDAVLRQIETLAVKCLDDNQGFLLLPLGKPMRSRLYELGVIEQEKNIDWNEVLFRVVNILGDRVIKFVLPGDIGFKWLQSAVGYSYSVRTIYAVLLTVFCHRWEAKFGKRTGVLEAIPGQLGPVSAEKLAREKERYLALHEAGVKHLPQKYIWKFINKWDPDWLRALPRRYKTRSPKIDWAERDRMLVQDCRLYATRLRAATPPVRILPSAILRQIQLCSDRIKTPLFYQELKLQTEPQDEWRKRKILFVMESKGVKAFSVRKILEISGLVGMELSDDVRNFCADLVETYKLDSVSTHKIAA